MKKFKILVILIFLVQTIFAQSIWNGSVDTTWYTNNKSAKEYTITTAEQLAGYMLLVRGSTRINGTMYARDPYDMSKKSFKLAADIMLNDTTDWKNWETTPPANVWNPIGRYDYFSPNEGNRIGTFDGNGFVVSGVYINSASDDYQGLFGYVAGGRIKNICVVASYIKGKNYVGGLAGYASIDNSYSAASVIGIGNYVGGLVGHIPSFGAISNSYSIGTVTGNDYVGGLVGGMSSSIISNSYSIGTVAGTGDSIGGLVGYIDPLNQGTINNSYYNMETSGKNDKGKGEGKTTAEMKRQSTFNNWVFHFTWEIDSEVNNGYPYLPKPKNEYTITKIEQLIWFGMLINNWDNFSGKTVKLGANIMLNDTTNWKNWKTTPPTNKWTPIGNKDKRFGGTFDGNGYIIGGIYISDSTSDYQGLFGADSNGVIKNLGVVASYIKGRNRVGGIVGENKGIISNSYSIATVIAAATYNYSAGWWEGGTGVFVGGLVGHNNYGGTINNSYSASAVTGTKSDYIGGLAGENNGIISKSYSTGMVTGDEYVGGLVGRNYNATTNKSDGTISNSYSTVAVIGRYYVGGLVGENNCASASNGTINNSYSIGMVTGEQNVGGLVGHNGCTINNSYYDMETSSKSDRGKGEGKTTAQMKQRPTFADWDFTEVWGINSKTSCGYPHLLGFEYEYSEECNITPIIHLPQVVNDQITISLLSLESFQIQGLTKSEKIRIFNLKGGVLLNRFVQPNEDISIAHLPKGVYLVNVAGKTLRFVK